MRLLIYIKNIIVRFKLIRFIPFKGVIIKLLDLIIVKKRGKIYKIIECSKKRNYEKLCLFANYDRLSIIHEYVIYHLKKIKELDFEIIMIITSKDLPEKEIDKVKNIVDKIIYRENVGYDFASWKEGLEIVGEYQSYKQILLTNDSIYGPIHDLKSVFEKMKKKNLDMWGMTDGFEHKYHLQSYFLVFNSRIIQSEFFKHFWNGVKYYPNALKSRIIYQYEIGLSRGALNHNFLIGSYIGYYDILEKILEHGTKNETHKNAFKRPLNPTLHLWKELLIYTKSPYLKVDLIKSNPLKSKNIYEWSYLIKESGYDKNLILNHLKIVFVNFPKKK